MLMAHSHSSQTFGRRLASFILFGNYYLAFCIVSLSVETALKNGFSLSEASYYTTLFFAVVVFYTRAYISDSGTITSTNPRSHWYHRNRKLIFTTQLCYTILVAGLLIFLLITYRSSFAVLTLFNWILLSVFPLIALLYYGVIFPSFYRIKLRSVSWIKPFLIGFVCTGAIVIYPMIFYSVQQQQIFYLSPANGFYFLTNWLFTTAIAIMFDIKDFAADHNYHLKTFVVAKGLRYTIFFILLPLSIASCVSFLVFAALKHFSFLQVTVNLIPFFLLLSAAASLRRRRGILYYLVVIDGLLLGKALFGIVTMTLLR